MHMGVNLTAKKLKVELEPDFVKHYEIFKTPSNEIAEDIEGRILLQLVRPWTGWGGIHSLLSLPGLADTNLEEVHKVTLERKSQPKPSSTTTAPRMVCNSPLDNNTSAGHGFHTRGLCFLVATVVEAMP